MIVLCAIWCKLYPYRSVAHNKSLLVKFGRIVVRVWSTYGRQGRGITILMTNPVFKLDIQPELTIKFGLIYRISKSKILPRLRTERFRY